MESTFQRSHWMAVHEILCLLYNVIRSLGKRLRLRMVCQGIISVIGRLGLQKWQQELCSRRSRSPRTVQHLLESPVPPVSRTIDKSLEGGSLRVVPYRKAVHHQGQVRIIKHNLMRAARRWKELESDLHVLRRYGWLEKTRLFLCCRLRRRRVKEATERSGL